MSNFTRVKPLGWSLYDILASALLNALDIDHAKSVNGDDGGSWAGPVIFTAGQLNGTSTVNTSGTIVSTNTITGNQLVSVNDVSGVDLLASSAVKTPIVLGDKYQPRTTSSQTLDNNVTNAVTCNLVTADTHYVDIVDTGGGSPTSATLGALTLTTATGDADFEIKKGAKFRIHFTSSMVAGAEVTTTMTWPATMKFRQDSDKFLMIEGVNDVAIYELEQIGTPGSPLFDVVLMRVKKG